MLFGTGPLFLTKAASRKTHGAAGTFDITLPIAGNPGVECRNSSGAHTLVFFFTNNVVSGSATLSAGTGSITGSPTFTDNTMTVDLTGVTDAQVITITLNNVTDVFGEVLPASSVSMGALIGDTTGNGTVNASDVTQTKGRSGQSLVGGNFRSDITRDGSINASDITFLKTRSGRALP
jgi:hypothetical protein